MARFDKKKRVIFAAALVTVSYLLKRMYGYAPITVFFMLATTAVAGIPIFRNAFEALKYKLLGIDALVTIAVIGALIIGEYWEAAAVTFLFMFGDYLESRTIEKTRSSIRALLDLAPDVTRVIRDGVEIEIDPEDVVEGEIVVVKPGEKISVDGHVLEGNAYINQANITGESLPVNKQKDDEVFSGTIVESGYLRISADRVGDDTTFARILEMVEEAQDKKAKTQKFLEKFSRYYTPGIIVLSALLYLITRDLVLSLTLLVIACPGALVISTPVSIVAGIGNGAKHGVLVKGGEIMENLGKIKVLAFDKTGTLTVGKPAVTEVHAYGIDEKELLRIAAIGEGYSEHPLGRAIIEHAKSVLGSVEGHPEEAEIITGQGIAATIEGKKYYLGNRKLMQENSCETDMYEKVLQQEEDKGQTAILIGSEGKILGIIAVADVVRSDAKKLIGNLKRQGIQKIVMLTGDNERAARAIAEELGLDGYYAELLPEDKVRVLSELQQTYGATGMVGDGVNDAPALASAELGIAIGGAGKDVAMETADVVLLSEEIRKLSHAIGLSRATVNNMKQNIYFAIAVAAMLLAGVLLKTVNLALGMLVHEMSVLLVIINAVRLLGFGDKGFSRKKVLQTGE
ncbi:MAG: cation-translocating P-type ATPase [Gudongella sp.]|jgi:Cd2+/Zn2+-exporting ATPase|nr:cation-translocating P-type ATPase [Gudongella sp.]